MQATVVRTEQHGENPDGLRVPKAVRSVLSNWLTYLVTGAVSFFLSPFIVKHLGNSAYGIWTLLVSLTGYLGFLDFGIRGAVTRYIAKFHAQADNDRASRTVSSATGLFLAAGFLSIVASVFFSALILPHLQIPSAYLQSAQIVIVIAGVNVAFSLVSGVFGGIVVGLQRFALLNSIALGAMAVRSFAIVIALRSGKGLITLALIQLTSTAGEFLLGFLFSRKLYPEVRIGFSLFDRKHVSLIFSFGLYALFLQLANYLIFYTDALVISAFLSVSMVTFFAVGANLTIYAQELVRGVSRTMTPLASRLEAEVRLEELQATTLKAARYCSIAMLPIFVTFFIRGKSFVHLWMGPSYADLSGHVLWILSVPWLFGVATPVVSSVVLGIGRHKPVVPVALAEGLTNLVLSIALIKPLGIVGVAWGTAVPSLAVSLLFWPYYAHRTIGIPIMKYALSFWALPALAIIPFTFLTYFVERLWPASSLLVFFVQMVCLFPAVLLGFWLFALPREERHRYSRQLTALFKCAVRNDGADHTRKEVRT